MKGQSYWILALIFALLIAIFAVINVEPVEVNYLFGTGELPLILVILISALLGGIVTAAAGSVRYFQLQREVRKLRSSKKGSTSPETADSQTNKKNHMEHKGSTTTDHSEK